MADTKSNESAPPAAAGPCALELEDRISYELQAAAAIVDCLRVLTALERAPEAPATPGRMMMGQGWANGVTLHDDSMSVALWHVGRLLEGAQKTSDQLVRMASGR